MNFHSKHAPCQEKRQAVVWGSVTECQIDLDSDATMKSEILESPAAAPTPQAYSAVTVHEHIYCATRANDEI